MMVRSGNGDRVDVLADLVEHLAIIGKLFEIGELLAKLCGLSVHVLGIDIAEADDMTTAIGGIAAVAIAFAGDADTGNIDAIIGSQHSPHVGKSESGGAGGNRGASKKLTAA